MKNKTKKKCIRVLSTENEVPRGKEQVGRGKNLTVNYSSNFKNFSKYTEKKRSSFKRKVASVSPRH